MDIDSYLIEARNLWENAYYMETYELYERLAKEYPLDARILRDNGLAYYAESDMDIALLLLEQSDAICSNDIVTVLGIAELHSIGYGTTLLWHEALPIFERAIALRPHNKKVVSLSFIQIGSVSPSINERISAYQKASNADPESKEAHWCLAVELWRANRFQESWNEWKCVEYYVNKHGEATDSIQKYLQMTEKEIASPSIGCEIPSILKDWFEGTAQRW